MKITDSYRDVPVSGRYGVGNYTYQFVLDNSTGVYKYNIFANTINEVLYIIGCNFGNVISWNYIGNDVMNLVLQGYPDGSALIYQ